MRTRPSGFTLVELIGILIIIGVLAVVAVPRLFDRPAFDARAFSDQTQAMLRYAQKLAIARNNRVHVRLDNSGSRIALCFDQTCNSQVRSPASTNSRSEATLNACGSETWFCEAPRPGVTITTSPATTAFYFDALGKPFATDDTDLPRLTITISGQGVTHDVIVEQETGYVHP
jgi:MSHA pilin protein MshC